MKEFNDRLQSGCAIGEDILSDVLAKYPWFTTARVIDCGTKGVSANLAIQVALATKPAPEISLKCISSSDLLRPSTYDIIDSFLEKGEHKIVPKDNIPEYDTSAADTAIADDDSDDITEELAEIYIKQGLNDMAKEIYRKLSLVNPEKSVYFAEIITKIDNNKTEN